MLKRTYSKLEDLNKEYKGQLIIIIVENKEEITPAINHLRSHAHKIKGIQVRSSLLNEVLKKQNSEYINFYSIILENSKDVSEIKVSKEKYFELVIPVEFFNENMIKLLKPNIVILDFQKQKNSNNINELFSTLITNKYYPYTKNIPLCHISLQHASEMFINENREKSIKKKPENCSPCILKEYCNYSKNFIPTPITNKEKNKDLIEFLEVRNNENSANIF